MVLHRATLKDGCPDTILGHFIGAQTHLAVIDQDIRALTQCIENFRMGDGKRVRFVGGLAADQKDFGTRLEASFASGQFSKAEFGSLQIDKNGDGPSDVRFNIAHRIHEFGELVVRRMAHIDAKHIDAREEQRLDLFLRIAGGT